MLPHPPHKLCPAGGMGTMETWSTSSAPGASHSGQCVTPCDHKCSHITATRGGSNDALRSLAEGADRILLALFPGGWEILFCVCVCVCVFACVCYWVNRSRFEWLKLGSLRKIRTFFECKLIDAPVHLVVIFLGLDDTHTVLFPRAF